MSHTESHPLAGKTVYLNDNAEDPLRGILLPGTEFVVEDWYDFLGGRGDGRSWMSDATFTTMHYGQRVNYLGRVPDDEVVYGHVGAFGHIVHVSELGGVKT